MTVARASGDRIRLTARSGRSFTYPPRRILCYKRAMGIPYAAIGFGISALLGIWAFIVAETDKARAVIAGVPFLMLLVRQIAPRALGRSGFLIGAMVYGIGCLVYLRFHGVELR